ncbi:MAG: PQQ-dependent sugar dehydrogenase [Chloroflexia bacterium]
MITRLNKPTAVRFAPDGRVFVAEKTGVIKSYPGLADTEPTIVADLLTNVNAFYDRGLLGFVLDPQFPAVPNLYVAYAYDAPIGGTAPVWKDNCTDNEKGCLVSGRLSRLALKGDGTAGPEQVLVEDWCQQFGTHSLGGLVFGPDGALYVSGGEGANQETIDHGQFDNACGDPADAGGALRAQAWQTPDTARGYSGTVLRVDPANPGDRRVIAYGFRNPFRIATRPGTNETLDRRRGQWHLGGDRPRARHDRQRDAQLWLALLRGPVPEGGFQPLGTPRCAALYNTPSKVTQAYYQYKHGTAVVPNENCNASSDRSPNSSITALGFYNGTAYPDSYKGALFFTDYARGCILGDEDRPGRATRPLAPRTGAGPGRHAGGPPGRPRRQPLLRRYLDRAGQQARLRGPAGARSPGRRRAGGDAPGCYTCRTAAHGERQEQVCKPRRDSKCLMNSSAISSLGRASGVLRSICGSPTTPIG